MTRDNILVFASALAYLGILAALAYMAVFQSDGEARTALIALASPGVVAAGVAASRNRIDAAVVGQIAAAAHDEGLSSAAEPVVTRPTPSVEVHA